MLPSKKNNKGFTIIEVMIVLAVGGLIMVMVFLAVPALQRNSRNSGYKNDAGRILAAVSEFISNNNGKTPATHNWSTATATGAPTPTATTSNDAKSILDSAGNKDITKLTITAATTAVTPTLSDATLVLAAKCPDTVSGVNVTPVTGTANGVATRMFAIIYGREESNGTVAACLGS